MRFRRQREWFAFTRLGLTLTHWRMEAGCRLLGHDWRPIGSRDYCNRCLRHRGEWTPQERDAARAMVKKLLDGFVEP